MRDGFVVARKKKLEARPPILVHDGQPPCPCPHICIAHHFPHDLMRMLAGGYLVRQVRAIRIEKRAFASFEVEVIARHARLPFCGDENSQLSFEFPRNLSSASRPLQFRTGNMVAHRGRRAPRMRRVDDSRLGRGHAATCRPIVRRNLLDRGLRDRSRSVDSVRFGQQVARLRAAGPADDLEAAVEVLHYGGTALDPVAAIDVAAAGIIPDYRMMDMTADDAVDAMPPGFSRNRLLVLADEIDGVLDL